MALTASILDTIKKMLGIPPEDTAFDQDVLVNINAAFLVLKQINVGPVDGYSIEDNSAVWADFLGADLSKLHAVKNFIWLKVRLAFDPPTSSFVLDSMARQIAELEWRICSEADPYIPPVVPPEE